MGKRKFQTLPLKVLKKRALELKTLWKKNKLSDEELKEFYGIFYELVIRSKEPGGMKAYKEKFTHKGV